MNEFIRLYERAARKLSHFWIFEPCVFNMQYFYDPQYLIDLNTNLGQFQGVLDPYITIVQNRYNAQWASAHQDYQGFAGSAPAAPVPDTSSLYIAAYLELVNTDPLTDVWATTPIDYTPMYSNDVFSTTPAAIITEYRNIQKDQSDLWPIVCSKASLMDMSTKEPDYYEQHKYKSKEKNKKDLISSDQGNNKYEY